MSSSDPPTPRPQREVVSPSAPRPQREVVSFVRRSARMNPSQQRAWQAHAAEWVVEFDHRELSTSVAPGQRLDQEAVWGRTAPLWVEIGPGHGEGTAAIARAHPEVNVLAFEVYRPSIASGMGLMAREGITNVRFAQVDGLEALAHAMAPGTVDRLFMFFPDPWHKARHHKRRLVNPASADLVASRLAVGAGWHIATDWEDYAQHCREVLDPHPLLANPYADGDGWAPRYPERPITRFEQRGLDAGRRIHDLTYLRVGAAEHPVPTSEQAPRSERVRDHG